ncbi:NAD-dependent epimerase/dehydratase family protein [Planobispora takensis]|uniref:Epimerase n=1 Tax=Planobispora takensis TaxID=1367882 RepID=A0A8J3T362_9ACTN|nr:NAD-dependent epimerase/dehydratase family protein [Planobispora takensis]GII04040.1 epimerase [Planobispora takensis]
MNRRGPRFLVTGATGFIGINLVRRIRTGGDRVTALVRPSSPPERRAELERLGVRCVEGDLETGAGLAAAAAGADRVIHLAGLVKARTAAAYFRVNATGTRRLVSALAARPDPPRLVVCSSLAAAPTGGRPPVSLYGRSKLAAEAAARHGAARLPVVIVRPPVVYGPGDAEFLPSLLPMARRGVMLKGGLGPRRFSLIHVGDLCTALLAAAERGRVVGGDDPAAGVYTVSDGVDYSAEDICRALARALGRRPPLIIPVPGPLVFLAAAGSELAGRVRGTVPVFSRDKARELRCPAWTCTTGRAAADLGFRARTTLDHGLAELVRDGIGGRP